MLRRTVARRWQYGNHYYGPVVPLPEEFGQRLANPKPVHLTKFRDPKNEWGLHSKERVSMHPSISGLDRHNHSLFETRGGPIADVPPVPVYRQHIWCMGHHRQRFGHPRIFIKCPPMKVVACKWCRLKFINMATEEDNDEDWIEEMHEIATTPETEEELMQLHRTYEGVLRPSNYQDGATPDPFVHRSVFDPERYKWKKKGEKMIPPSQWKAEEEAAKLGSGHSNSVSSTDH